MAWEEIIFPNNIRNIRLERGMKMTELARQSGLSLSAVSKIEKGVRRLNQAQLLNLCRILHCKLSDVFIKASDNIADQWQTEMKRRLKDNEGGGLKIFGAGLRLIRRGAGKTIARAAKDAHMTLSVYHKVEVGQREVYENEIGDLAKSFGKTVGGLFDEIAQLYKSGELTRHINKVEEKVKSVLIPGNPLSDMSGSLYGSKLYDNARKKLVPVFGMPSAKGIVLQKSDAQMIVAPGGLEGRAGVYAIVPNSKRLNGIIPEKSHIFADTGLVAGNGDLAVAIDADFEKLDASDTAHAQILSLREDARGKLYGQAWGPEEKITIKDQTLHKVVMIVIE
ncbi:MAG: XRE family transcriptional regulator [Rickettsiales bacterium]|jgi:transcriptional regulator with XRE-family HTH domain|nr:XRE family transcriptional regulator [Rickettsiales bacterium]